MLRSVLSVIAGAVVWMAGFFVLVSLVAVSWPDYVVHGRQWTQEGVFTFTPLMACFNLLAWALAGIAAGWVAMKIAKRHVAVWVLAGLIEIYVVTLHIVLSWTTFPWWYNLGVVIPAIPAILLGAKLAGMSSSANATAVAG